MLPLGCDYTSRYTIHQGPYTKVHTPSYFRGFKCPYTCLFLYRKKLKMSTFLVYLYKKKPLRPSRGPYTSVHLNTCTPNSVLRFCATCAILTKLSWPLFSLHVSLVYITYRAQRTVGDYLSCTAHCGGLPIVHSALWGITYRAQRTVGDYLLIFHELWGITHYSSTNNNKTNKQKNEEWWNRTNT